MSPGGQFLVSLDRRQRVEPLVPSSAFIAESEDKVQNRLPRGQSGLP